MAWLETFEPLRVTATFGGNVICDPYLPLDGILYYQANREQKGAQEFSLPGGHIQAPGMKHVSMPLAIVNHGSRNWYFACSFAHPSRWWNAEGMDYWNKRFDSSLADLIDFRGRRGSVNIGKGEFKAYHAPVNYRSALTCQWFCVGDKKWIERLLSTVTHIGAKTAQGWGRVREWCVERVEEDWSVWKNGRLTRAVPAQDVLGKGSFRLAYYGLRPSYHRADHQMKVALP